MTKNDHNNNRHLYKAVASKNGKRRDKINNFKVSDKGLFVSKALFTMYKISKGTAH